MQSTTAIKKKREVNINESGRLVDNGILTDEEIIEDLPNIVKEMEAYASLKRSYLSLSELPENKTTVKGDYYRSQYFKYRDLFLACKSFYEGQNRLLQQRAEGI